MQKTFFTFIISATLFIATPFAAFGSLTSEPDSWPFLPTPTKTPTLQELPKLNVDMNRITVSGVSSGGFMAVQLHVAHSSLFQGAASVAGGIWECAKGDSGRSQTVCMMGPQSIDVKELTDLARERAKRGEIDDLKNLASSRVAIFASPKDMVIKAVSSDKLEEFYREFVTPTSITRLTHPTAAHGFPTLSYGNACGSMGAPWILNCNDDLAGKLLASTEPHGRTLAARGTQDLTSLIYFDQSKIVKSNSHLYAWGAAYVPRSCRIVGAKCGVHVALHGCQMNPDFIQQKFIENAGYNEWAESNDLIVLYPQAAKGTGNPYACWDWFGYSGSNYTTKAGVQIEAIRTILSHIGVR